MQKVTSVEPVMTTNIPNHQFLSSNVVCETQQVYINHNIRANFEVNGPTLHSLMEGVRAMADSDVKVKNKHVQFLFKLVDLVNAYNQNNGDVSLELDLQRTEVILAKEVLEARMKHCEVERDLRITTPDGHPKFNADTYIGMKMLLLDIREWLMGEVVEDISMIKNDPADDKLVDSYAGMYPNGEYPSKGYIQDVAVYPGEASNHSSLHRHDDYEGFQTGYPIDGIHV